METGFSAMHHLPVRDLERLATILRVAAEKGWGHYVEPSASKGIFVQRDLEQVV